MKKKKRVREGFVEIAIAGYTNAGKSTLHNALTNSKVEIADKLFTTLSTKAADLDLPGRQIVLSDSVGFISDLPESLLQAFNTTLMEIGDADLILLVVDASDSLDETQRKIDACVDAFNEIGVNGIPIMAVLNKIDLVDSEDIQDRIGLLEDISVEVVPISASNETNLDTLLAAIERVLPQLTRYSIHLPYGDDSMAIISRLHEDAIIESETYNEDSIVVVARCNPEVFQTLEYELNPGSIKKLISD